MGQEQQAAMFMPILEGLDGVEKMSKSLGNYIGVNEEAKVMFKKVMEVPDNLIIKYFELATDEHPDTIDKIKEQLAQGKNPRDVKFELAKIITGLYHTEEELIGAIEFYEKAFSKKAIPDDIPVMEVEELKTILELSPILVIKGVVPSNKEFRRLIEQGGVQLNGEKLGKESFNIMLKEGDVLKIGKKKFIKLKMG